MIYCYVERNETGVVVDQDFDLFSTQYYLFIAIGDDVFPNRILQHKQIAVSARAIFLRDVTDLAVANKPLLIQLHGCFMIVAWMGTAAVGLVLARYFKNEWSGKTLFGKDLWFIVSYWNRLNKLRDAKISIDDSLRVIKFVWWLHGH